MAFITDEQKQAHLQLRAEYGMPNFVRLEYTDEPYGILWLQWDTAILGLPRNLFIRPDGTRLSWTGLVSGTL